MVLRSRKSIGTTGTTAASGPSQALLRGALSGLLGVGGLSACGGSSNNAEPDPTPDAKIADANPVDAAIDAGADSKIISETEGTRTFASLKDDCDARGGYIQIHAACAGVNTCQGFSYGDWDPGVLTEHTCAGVNGCNGLSCVVLPEDSGKSAVDILNEELPETGSRSCMNCHALWDENGPDTSKFKVWVLPESGRTLGNWLEVSAESQARIVAFGKMGTLGDGVAFSHMAPYYKIYSRAEIERVVDYVRTTPEIVISEVKVDDAMMLKAGPKPLRRRPHGIK